MSDPFLGQIIAVGFNFAPVGWLECAGQALSISDYEALYTLLGTSYGGNGTTTFNLPDLRGRAAVNQGQGPGLSTYTMGQSVGVEAVTLTPAQIGAHSHMLMAGGAATASTPTSGTVIGTPTSEQIFLSTGTTVPASVTLAASSITPYPGGNQPHENRQPYQTVNYIIATAGVFPTHG